MADQAKEIERLRQQNEEFGKALQKIAVSGSDKDAWIIAYKTIMWAQIRRVHQTHDLPGEILTTEWKMDGTVVAYGFRPADLS